MIPFSFPVSYLHLPTLLSGEPFFLYMAYVKLHTALFTGPEFTNRSGKGEWVDNVEELDWSVGRILDALDAAGVADDTLVFLTSDNGPFVERGHDAGNRGAVHNSAGDLVPLRGAKGQNWEGGVRVPGIVRWKGRVKPRVSNQLVSTMDILPTVLSLSGVAIPGDRQIDGRSMEPLFFADEEQQKNTTLVHDNLIHYCGEDVAAIRHGDFKMHFRIPLYEKDSEPICVDCCPKGVICHCGLNVLDDPILFNLADDPGEASPLQKGVCV